jgi:hypothetical protein
LKSTNPATLPQKLRSELTTARDTIAAALRKCDGHAAELLDLETRDAALAEQLARLEAADLSDETTAMRVAAMRIQREGLARKLAAFEGDDTGTKELRGALNAATPCFDEGTALLGKALFAEISALLRPYCEDGQKAERLASLTYCARRLVNLTLFPALISQSIVQPPAKARK